MTKRHAERIGACRPWPRVSQIDFVTLAVDESNFMHIVLQARAHCAPGTGQDVHQVLVSTQIISVHNLKSPAKEHFASVQRSNVFRTTLWLGVGFGKKYAYRMMFPH